MYDYTGEPPEESRLFEGDEAARHWTRLLACRSLLHESGLPEIDIDRRILDVGGGDGYSARALLYGLEPGLYVGTDVSKSKLIRASTRFDSGAGAVGSAERLPFRSGCFDSVLCLEVLEHLPDPLTCAQEIARVTRGGGFILISVPVDSFAWYALLRAWHWLKSRLRVPSSPKQHIQVFTKRRFRKLLRLAGLREISLGLVAFSIPFFGVCDSRTTLGRVVEGILRRLPMNNFGFVWGTWKFSIGRQHVVVVGAS